MLPYHHSHQAIHLASHRQSPLTAHPIAAQMIYTDQEKIVYTVSKIDSAKPPTAKGNVCFEVTVTLGQPEQRIFVGLLETTLLGHRKSSPGIGISIDPCTGVIMDVVNDQGVIGYIEDENLLEGRELTIKVEIEVLKHVCIPKLTIGTEIFLHPSLYLESLSRLTGLVGTAVVPHAHARFSDGRLAVQEMSGGLSA